MIDCKVIFKRKMDKTNQTIYVWDGKIHEFFQNLITHKTTSLEGRLFEWKFQDIEIFQIFEINYSLYDKSRWGYLYHTSYYLSDTWTYEEYVPTYELDKDFEPEEEDITNQFIIQYIANKWKRIQDEKRKITMSYDENKQNLIFNNKSIDISWDSIYQVVSRILLKSWEESVSIMEIASDYYGVDNPNEKERKSVKNAFDYGNKKIVKAWVEDFFWITEKTIRCNYFSSLKNSNQQI